MSVQQSTPENQLPKEILAAFSELTIFKHLRQAGITRNMGFACSYLFKLIFCLLFQHRNWFQVLESKKNPKGFPAKDAIYRFLNAPSFAWRRFFSAFTASVIAKVSILTHPSRLRVMIVDDSAYERNRSKRVELLARCFDHVEHVYYKGFRMLTLTEQEIVHLYSSRWEIETFFKCCKSLLQLRKEFQGRSYDLLISHTTIVFVRYIVLSWQHRQQKDDRTLGGLFFDMCDELSDLDWTIALKQLLDILQGVATKANKRIADVISCQLSHWFAGLPSYIKAYLPLSLCES